MMGWLVAIGMTVAVIFLFHRMPAVEAVGWRRGRRDTLEALPPRALLELLEGSKKEPDPVRRAAMLDLLTELHR